MSLHAGQEAQPVVTALHRAAPEAKVAALVLFAIGVALVPRGVWWPYALDLALVLGLAAWARVAPRELAARLLVELPFVLVVLGLPFTAGGPEVQVLGVGLSEAGIEAAWGVACKATLVVLAAGVLASTTTAPEILAGLERLRVPRQLTAVGAFAVRYVQVVLDELRRLQRARTARGDDPRWVWQGRAAGRSAGALAVRCLERGERVHRAMLARGFDGRLPQVGVAAPTPVIAMVPVVLVAAAPALAAAVLARAGGLG